MKSMLQKLLMGSLLLPIGIMAQNPIIQTSFTPDPAPYVHNDTVYLFVDHDEDDALYFKMKDWMLYSTTDMVNWTYRGTPMSTATFQWAKQGDNAWASQAVERNGKWYWYICAEDTTKHLHGIGVGVADRPEGPYHDVIGKPLVPGSWGFIDPSVFIDEDGQAYLFWGNNGLWYAKLNEDMISLGSEVMPVQGLDNPDAFGPLKKKYDYQVRKEIMKTNYEEGPWVFKRNGLYYMVYAAGGVPEHMAYSTSENINGPWKYRGRIQNEAENSFTIHGGSIEFKGRNFMFYHNGILPNGGGFHRSSCVEEFTFGENGEIPFIPFTKEGVKTPAGTLNPFQRVEAETMAYSYGLKTDRLDGTEHFVTSIHNGDWIKLRAVDFGEGKARSLKAAFQNIKAGGTVEFFIDNLGGDPIARLQVTTVKNKQVVPTRLLKEVSGVHDLYILFRNMDGEMFDFDWWQLSEDLTYRNPILNADVPDMSVCFDGNYYYMVSTTMHLMPGAPIMRSPDMQHWETVSYVFPRIDDGDRYNLIGGTAYGQGQWASSIRYHNGRFYVWFTANGAPGKGFIFTTEDPTGEWTLLSRPRHHHDGSLFFDDDGRVYLFHGTGQLTELNPDLSDVLPGGTNMKIFERDADEQALLEGSAAFKHNGKYYLMMISMDWSIPGRLRREVCYRADQITGPYEKKVILETEFEGYGGAGQGCVVQGKNGEWHALIFQDRGGIGRVPSLMPCTWKDGWPMLGDEYGNIPNDTSIPHASMKGICGSDDFNSDKLSLYWQWNHNPIDEAWSLTARRGSLRLKTARVVDNLFVAPNTLTQRMVGPECEAVVCLNVSKMKDGDRAGFSAFNGDSGVLTVEKNGNKKELVMSEQHAVFNEPGHTIREAKVTEKARIELKQNKIWLKIRGDFHHGEDWAYFAYSLDGKNWQSIGERVRMVFDYRRMFMGSKYAIFNYATRKTGGYVDVESFDYNM